MTVVKIPRYDYNTNINSGRGAVRLARLHGVQEVGGSNPLAPTGRLQKRSLLFFGGFLCEDFATLPPRHKDSNEWSLFLFWFKLLLL
jgi:hypothetical protein